MSEVKLYNGDCLEKLKDIADNSIDLIVTDPPYDLDTHGGKCETNFAIKRNLKILNNHIKFISDGFDYDKLFNEFMRICKKPNFIIFCSNKQISKIMSWFENKKLKVTLLVWHKTNCCPLGNGKHISDIEFIVYVRGKGATFNNDVPLNYKSKVYSSSTYIDKNKLHPTQKRVEHIIQYIKLHSKENDVVLDCFMGSGTTGVACVNTNRNFIGIELNKEYFDIASNRINEAQNKQKEKLF